MRYDIEKRTFLVKKFTKLNNSTLVQRAWRSEFKNLKAPCHKTIVNLVSKFDKTGSVADLSRKSDKPNDKRENAKIVIEAAIAKNPSLSVPKLSVCAKISPTLTWHILRDDLKLRPYKYQDGQKLEPADYLKRVEFANWFLSLPKYTEKFLVCSDEAYFYLTESTNKQNNRKWLNERPFDLREKPLHDEKVLVWCAMSSRKIYGPYFFNQSVNQHNYLEMIQNFFWPMHYRIKDSKKYYFQQDGAKPHTANIVQEWFSDRFEDRFIDQSKWPPRSPDLNPCDFFLWGHLKSRVYNPLPTTIDQLKANIEREIQKINQETLDSVFDNFLKRCDLVITAQGGHIELK